METLVKDAAPGVELVPEKQGGKRRSLRKRDGRRHQGVLGFLERKNCPPQPRVIFLGALFSLS